MNLRTSANGQVVVKSGLRILWRVQTRTAAPREPSQSLVLRLGNELCVNLIMGFDLRVSIRLKYLSGARSSADSR